MKIGDKLDYFGKTVTVIDLNYTHCLVRFEDGTKLCTNKNTFFNDKN
jgi:hypothetical protein